VPEDQKKWSKTPDYSGGKAEKATDSGLMNCHMALLQLRAGFAARFSVEMEFGLAQSAFDFWHSAVWLAMVAEPLHQILEW